MQGLTRVKLNFVAKTTIKGRFATAADAATVHGISDARRRSLDREIEEATAKAVVYFVPAAPRNFKVDAKQASSHGKRNGKRRSANTIRLPAKKK